MVLLCQPIELREHVIEQRDDLLRGHLRGERRKVHQVGKQHGHVCVRIGDRARIAPQALRDRPRQDVQKQLLRALLCFVSLPDDIAHQQDRHYRQAADVQSEEDRAEHGRNRWSARRDRMLEDSRGGDEDKEDDQPSLPPT